MILEHALLHHVDDPVPSVRHVDLAQSA